MSVLAALSPLVRASLPPHAQYLPTSHIILPQYAIEDVNMLTEFLQKGFIEGSLKVCSKLLEILQLFGIKADAKLEILKDQEGSRGPEDDDDEVHDHGQHGASVRPVKLLKKVEKLKEKKVEKLKEKKMEKLKEEMVEKLRAQGLRAYHQLQAEKLSKKITEQGGRQRGEGLGQGQPGMVSKLLKKMKEQGGRGKEDDGHGQQGFDKPKKPKKKKNEGGASAENNEENEKGGAVGETIFLQCLRQRF